MKLPSGYTLHAHDSIDSTSSEAKKLAVTSQGNAVVWAKTQTAGRGRYDRGWVSETGNLFATLLLFPEVPAKRLPQLSFVMALAARQATSPQVQFKWPNDIMLGGKKAGGILLESGMAGGRRFVTAGIGINVAAHPEKVLYPATHLAAEGITISVDKLLEQLVNAFEVCYRDWQEKGFAPIRSAWLKAARGVGEKLEVRLPGKTVQGTFRGISAEGALELELPDGTVEQVTAGDVFLLG